MAVAALVNKEAEAEEQKAPKHSDPAPMEIPSDLPPGTKATLVGPDETPVVGNERKRLPKAIIYRNIDHPNLKILGREVLRPSPDDPTKMVRYRLPMIKFHETTLRIEYEDEKEIVERCIPKSQLYIEPHSDEGGTLMEYRDEHGRVLFATRNPQAYMAFERKMRT
jgi:hypothetical protein